jgi:hypothetical protein
MLLRHAAPSKCKWENEMSDDVEAKQPEEPCIGCGEDTAVGSVFFSDRKVVEDPDGRRAYVCSLCVARIRSAGHHESLNSLQDLSNLYAIGLVSSLPG